ncbi:MAG: hypothetical protein ABIO02_02690, partial [Patescibacteria group bacterium]
MAAQGPELNKNLPNPADNSPMPAPVPRSEQELNATENIEPQVQVKDEVEKLEEFIQRWRAEVAALGPMSDEDLKAERIRIMKEALVNIALHLKDKMSKRIKGIIDKVLNSNPEVKDAQNKSLAILTKLFDLLKDKDSNEALSAGLGDLDPVAFAVFEELSRAAISPEAAPYIVHFVTNILSEEYTIKFSADENKSTLFEGDFKENIRINKSAAKLLRESIMKTVRKRKIGMDSFLEFTDGGKTLDDHDIESRLQAFEAVQQPAQTVATEAPNEPLKPSHSVEEIDKNIARAKDILEKLSLFFVDKKNEIQKFNDIKFYLTTPKAAWMRHISKVQLNDPTEIDNAQADYKEQVGDYLLEATGDANSGITPEDVEFIRSFYLNNSPDRRNDSLYYLNRIENGDQIVKILTEQLSTNAVLSMLFEQGTDGKYRWKTIRDTNSPNGTKEDNRGVDQFLDRLHDVLGLLYEKLDQNPGQDYQKLFVELIEGAAQREIATVITALANNSEILDQLADPKTKQQFKDFIQGKARFELIVEDNYRQLLHVFPTYVTSGDKSKDWGAILSQYRISEISLFTSDKLIEIMMAEYPNFIQEEMLQHDNLTPADFLAGVLVTDPNLPKRAHTYKYTTREKFIKHMERVLMQSGQATLFLDENGTSNRINRAVSIATGLLLVSGEAPSVMANGKPIVGWEQQTMAALLEAMNPEMYILQGRGGMDIIRNLELYVMTYHRETLMKPLRVKKEVEDRDGNKKEKSDWIGSVKNMFYNLSVMAAYRWDPKKEFDKGKDWVHRLEDLKNNKQFYDQILPFYLDYMADARNKHTWAFDRKRLSAGGHVERGDFRADGLLMNYLIAEKIRFQNGDVNDIKAKFAQHYDEAFKWFYRDAGVAYGFVSGLAQGRARKDAMRVFFSSREASREDLSDRDYEKLLRDLGGHEYHHALHAHRYKNRDFANAGMAAEHMSLKDFEEYRTRDIRGETFYHLLLKDPLAFLNNFGQLIPQISNGMIFVPEHKESGQAAQYIKASEYYFGLNPKTKKPYRVPNEMNDDRKRVIAFLVSRFAPEPEKETREKIRKDKNTKNKGLSDVPEILPNVDELKKIMDLYANLSEEYRNDDDVKDDVEKEIKISAENSIQKNDKESDEDYA